MLLQFLQEGKGCWGGKLFEEAMVENFLQSDGRQKT